MTFDQKRQAFFCCRSLASLLAFNARLRNTIVRCSLAINNNRLSSYLHGNGCDTFFAQVELARVTFPVPIVLEVLVFVPQFVGLFMDFPGIYRFVCKRFRTTTGDWCYGFRNICAKETG